jgi:hypothetical protein
VSLGTRIDDDGRQRAGGQWRIHTYLEAVLMNQWRIHTYLEAVLMNQWRIHTYLEAMLMNQWRILYNLFRLKE